MVLNTLDDNSVFYSPYYTVLENALAGFGIVSGCAISKGTGNWDIDVTAGTVFVTGTGQVSVSSGTVTLTAPGSDADMGAGESRIDLVTANNSGTLAAVEGTAATNPDAPDVPANEVVLGFVVVANSDSTAADSDITNIPANESARPLHQEGFGELFYAALDDFADNSLTGRDGPGATAPEFSAGVVANYFRPEWESITGSISASSSKMQVGAGNSTQQVSRYAHPGGLPVEFEATVEAGSSPSSGAFVTEFAVNNNARTSTYDNTYRVLFNNDGSVDLEKVVGNSTTKLVDGGTFTLTDPHTVKVTRQGGTWELFVDGTSKGTASDASHLTAAYSSVFSNADVAFTVDSWKVA